MSDKTAKAAQALEEKSSQKPEINIETSLDENINSFSEAEDTIKGVADQYHSWAGNVGEFLRDLEWELEDEDVTHEISNLQEYMRETNQKLDTLDDAITEANTLATIFEQFQNSGIYEEVAATINNLIDSANELQQHVDGMPTLFLYK